MTKEEYAKLVEEVGKDHDIDSMQAVIEGLTILRRYGGKTLSAGHEVIYCDGPEINEVSEEDARRLSELGFQDYDNDMGWTFFT